VFVLREKEGEGARERDIVRDIESERESQKQAGRERERTLFSVTKTNPSSNVENW